MSSSSIVFREVPISGHVFRRKRKSGDRWMAKWRDGEGQHQAVLGKAWTKRGRPAEGYLTKQGAQRELDAILADARRHRITSQPRLASTVTFGEAAREWLRYVEHDRKRRPSTVADYRWIVERRLLPDFGELALEAVTTQRIDRWRVELVAAGGIADGEGLSARTINKYLGVIHSILKRAQRTYGLAANAAAWAERQPVTRSGDFDVLSAAEVEALARAAREGHHRKPPKHPTGFEWRAKLRQQDQQDAAIFLTAAYAGLRLGELRSLRWRDLDFAKRLIHVRHSYVMRNEDAPKSGRVRSVPMIDQVAVALDQLSRRNGWTGEEDLVFVNPAGEHIEDSALRRRFYAALKAAGLKHIRFHDLRHSFGTLAVQVFPLTDVKAYMGHADIATTMIYVHHVPQVDAAEKLSAALREASTGPPAPAARPAA
ncbi:MAG TPA: tyrosine-type recombinase/integrase [Solirubrobacterales bacterium]|nr:tyrosine-type recombinase/integrase [Solirubrobacterales bacterium]